MVGEDSTAGEAPVDSPVDGTYRRLRSIAHQDLGHEDFLKLAPTAMRPLVVDYARRRNAVKRGSGAFAVELDPMLERIVECRFFAGMTMQETAAVLERPMRTVERDWPRARACHPRA